MASRRRQLAGLGLASLLAALIVLGEPAPSPAQANIACDAASAPAHAITGAIGAGNPLGDACNAVTDGALGAVTVPIGHALQGIGNGIFNQITSWVTQGAGWLIGQVVWAINKTTTPQLTGKGFVSQYRQMAEIAAFLAAGMLLFCVLEGLAQGSAGMLARVVLVNVPLAFLATSVAYLLVQLLLAASDGLTHAIAVSTNRNSAHFFAGAIHGLSQAGGGAGAVAGTATGGLGAGTAAGGLAGATAAPLFVTFLAAAIGAFAAFFVWIELLMRDAAVYVVALFMPLALAASIWPRWSGALRRTAELLVVVIASKFVIVSIITLAAGLLASNAGQVEQILAASALMLLACFAPFMLLKLVPFAEGAVVAAYGRRSASGGAVSGMQLMNSAQMVRNTARSNWGASSTGQPQHRGGGGGGAPGPGPGGGGAGGGGAPDAPSGTGGGAAAGAGGGAAAAAPLPVIAGVAAAKGARAAGQRLAETGTAQAAGNADGSTQRPQRPAASTSAEEPGGGAGGGKPASAVPRPQQEPSSGPPSVGEQPPRPAPELPARDESRGGTG